MTRRIYDYLFNGGNLRTQRGLRGLSASSRAVAGLLIVAIAFACSDPAEPIPAPGNKAPNSPAPSNPSTPANPSPPGTPPTTPSPPAAVASITLITSAQNVLLEQSADVQVTVILKDKSGNVLSGRTVVWSTNTPTIVTVSSVGIVHAIAEGTAKIFATSEGLTSSTTISVMPRMVSVTLSLSAVSVQQGASTVLSAHGSTADGRSLYVSGWSWQSSDPAIASVSVTGAVLGVSPGGPVSITATLNGISATAAVTVTPVSLPGGGITFASVAAGSEYSCGLTTAGAAYCWGFAQFGDATTQTTAVPQLVAGNLTFTSLSVHGFHACGIVAGGAAYCWGHNVVEYEFLSGSDVPVAVPGGHAFSMVSAGYSHSCGVTISGAAYCWGFAGHGELGTDSITVNTSCIHGEWDDCATPVAVSGGLTFSSVSAGSPSSCGITTGGRAYCWGSNDVGQLGIGSSTGPATCYDNDDGSGWRMCSRTPVAVAGGLTFTSIEAGGGGVCGVVFGGNAYCWGRNYAGQLGTGTKIGPEICNNESCATTPVQVVGGLAFSTVGVLGDRACGLTTSGDVYCWGQVSGPAGTPVKVEGGSRFATVSAGSKHVCGMSTDGVAYCWGWNDYGQLGSGTRAYSAVPVKVFGQR